MLEVTYFIKLNDVRMSDYLENVNFPGYSFDISLILDLILLQDLDCHLLTGKHVSAQPDFAESPLTQRSS
jgi:hypothetical protein